MFSLRRQVWLIFLATVLLLGIVILLGVRQYLVADRYSSVITENERALFQFATVRESVTEALIIRDLQKLEQLIPDLEMMNSSLARLLESQLVPAQFKLGLMDKIDIAGIVIKIRGIVNGGAGESQSRSVQEEMRTIADHLLKYDRIIVGQARSKMLNLQMVLIGSMGLVISILSFSLILLYRNSIKPMLSLTAQLRDEDIEPKNISHRQGVSREVIELTEKIKSQIKRRSSAEEREKGTVSAQYDLLAETVNETTNQLNGIINYAQLLADSEDRELPDQQKELLDKIMEAGTDIARSWKNLSIGGKQ